MFRRFRFGFLSLFAAMLLAISVAGWWKYHRDLHLEEQAVLAELSKVGCDLAVSRSGAASGLQPIVPAARAEAESEQAPSALIQSLRVYGDPPEDLRRRMARLPGLTNLRIYDGRESTLGGKPRNSPFPPVDEALGDAAPNFPKPQLVRRDLDRPHPRGERLTEDEAAKIVAEIRSAWSGPPKLADRFLSSVEAESPGSLPQVTRLGIVRDGDSYLAYRQLDDEVAALEIADPATTQEFVRRENGWRLVACRDRNASDQDGPAEEPALASIVRDILPRQRRDTADLDRVSGVERLDDVRVRIDFAPFERSFESALRADYESVRESSMVLREDLGWRIESVRELTQSMVFPDMPGSHVAEEHRYEPIGDFMLPVETLVGRTREGEPFLASSEWTHTRYAWSLDPQVGAATFDADRFLDVPLPPRGERAWRWYYGTFAIGLALSLFVAGRRLIGSLANRRRERPAARELPG